MLLSEAAILGSTMWPADPGRYFDSERQCGCFVGRAIVAAGFVDSSKDVSTENVYDSWPWLSNQHEDGLDFAQKIDQMFFDVAISSLPFNDMVDTVKEWEKLYDPQAQDNGSTTVSNGTEVLVDTWDAMHGIEVI